MRKQKEERAPARRRTYSDPLSAALVPPPNETASQRELRLKAELDAKKVSDSIDDMLHQERNEKKKLRPEVNVLLLGQSESGKSTTLKRKSHSLCATLQLLDHPHYPMNLSIMLP
jgi:polynucleotide 5'-kinase involved in rRNA processing